MNVRGRKLCLAYWKRCELESICGTSPVTRAGKGMNLGEVLLVEG